MRFFPQSLAACGEMFPSGPECESCFRVMCAEAPTPAVAETACGRRALSLSVGMDIETYRSQSITTDFRDFASRARGVKSTTDYTVRGIGQVDIQERACSSCLPRYRSAEVPDIGLPTSVTAV